MHVESSLAGRTRVKENEISKTSSLLVGKEESKKFVFGVKISKLSSGKHKFGVEYFGNVARNYGSRLQVLTRDLGALDTTNIT